MAHPCRRRKNFENWYYPMPEEGFSFFGIQTPWKILLTANPLNPAILTPPLFFSPQNGPLHHVGV